MTLSICNANVNHAACYYAECHHRERTRASTLCCFGFFPSFEHAKNLLIMGQNNTKNSSFKCDFLIFNYE
jgi:hypothetical protein